MSEGPRAATVYAASSPHLACKFPDTNRDSLWIADIKACGADGQCRVLREVIFVESYGNAFTFGIDHEDGRPRGVKAELAE